MTVTAAVSTAARTRQEQERDDRWLTEATKVVKHLAESQATLTTDDVWRAMGNNEPREGRLYGGLMKRCKTSGYIEPTPDDQPSTRPRCHHRPIRVWRSLLHDSPPLF